MKAFRFIVALIVSTISLYLAAICISTEYGHWIGIFLFLLLLLIGCLALYFIPRKDSRQSLTFTVAFILVLFSANLFLQYSVLVEHGEKLIEIGYSRNSLVIDTQRNLLSAICTLGIGVFLIIIGFLIKKVPPISQ